MEKRKKVISHYSKGKMCCNNYVLKILELLTIDHINNNGAEHRKTAKTNTLHLWLSKNDYPEGFHVLCWNCNYVKNIVTSKHFKEITEELKL